MFTYVPYPRAPSASGQVVVKKNPFMQIFAVRLTFILSYDTIVSLV